MLFAVFLSDFAQKTQSEEVDDADGEATLTALEERDVCGSARATRQKAT